MGTQLLGTLTGEGNYIPVVHEVERAFDGLGLMSGSWAPVKRFVFAGAAVYILQEAFKPGYAYDEAGNKRPWIYTQGESQHSTYVPFWAAPLVGAIFFSVFI